MTAPSSARRSVEEGGGSSLYTISHSHHPAPSAYPPTPHTYHTHNPKNTHTTAGVLPQGLTHAQAGPPQEGEAEAAGPPCAHPSPGPRPRPRPPPCPRPPAPAPARSSNSSNFEWTEDTPDFIHDMDGNPVRGFDPTSPGFLRMMSMVLGVGVAPVDPEFAAALGIGEEGGANKKKGGSGKGKGTK